LFKGIEKAGIDVVPPTGELRQPNSNRVPRPGSVPPWAAV